MCSGGQLHFVRCYNVILGSASDGNTHWHNQLNTTQKYLRVIRLPMYIFQRWPVWADLAGCLILPSWSWFFLTQMLAQNEFFSVVGLNKTKTETVWLLRKLSSIMTVKMASLGPECFKWQPPASVIKQCNWLPTAPVYGICQCVTMCMCVFNRCRPEWVKCGGQISCISCIYMTNKVLT